MDIAHPHSPNYGQIWTPHRVKETFAPSHDTIATVKEWLEEHGYLEDNIRFSKDRAWLEVDMTIEAAELLLEAKYHDFRQGDEEFGQMACDSYSLPSHIADHIDFITPGVALHSGRKKRSLSQSTKRHIHPNIHPNTVTTLTNISPDSLSNCSNAITPACVRALYDFHYKFDSSQPNAFAIAEFTPESYLPEDLDMFFKTFSPSLVGKRPKFHSIDGGVLQRVNQSFDFDAESSLDFEYAMTLVEPQQVDHFQVGDLIVNSSFNNLLDALDKSYCTFEGGDDPDEDGIYPDPAGFNHPENCGTVQTRVLSVSYGSSEFGFPASYLNRQCFEFGKLGLMGTTVIFSSGDSGVGEIEGCLDKTGQPSPNGTQFSPDSPVTCPFVTAVGATRMNPGSSVNDPESGFNISGGGFSRVFPRPSYQEGAVMNYLSKFTPNDAIDHFNKSNRGYPDVSANGFDYTIAVNGVFMSVFGTSASAPVFASIITAINDARRKIGKGTVGFINPAIYSSKFRDAFNDITDGSNPNCGTGGFVAAEGWDPVTGLGTPNFPRMLDLWLQLP